MQDVNAEKPFIWIVTGCRSLVCTASPGWLSAVMFWSIWVVHLGVLFPSKEHRIGRLVGLQTPSLPLQGCLQSLRCYNILNWATWTILRHALSFYLSNAWSGNNNFLKLRMILHRDAHLLPIFTPQPFSNSVFVHNNVIHPWTSCDFSLCQLFTGNCTLVEKFVMLLLAN